MNTLKVFFAFVKQMKTMKCVLEYKIYKMKDVNDWISNNYENIVQWSKNASYNHYNHLDLAHDIIEAFVQHEKAAELVAKGDARFFITRMLLNQARSNTSPFNKNYRNKNDRSVEGKTEWASQKLENIEVYMDSSVMDTSKTAYLNKILQNQNVQEDYDIDVDFKIEAIEGICEDLKLDSIEGYYCITIFEQIINQPKMNFSKLANETNIPRTSISKAYYRAIEMIQKRIQEYGHNL